jgi:hypothetical protein
MVVRLNRQQKTESSNPYVTPLASLTRLQNYLGRFPPRGKKAIATAARATAARRAAFLLANGASA